jgi:hypothetical protein
LEPKTFNAFNFVIHTRFMWERHWMKLAEITSKLIIETSYIIDLIGICYTLRMNTFAQYS